MVGQGFSKSFRKCWGFFLNLTSSKTMYCLWHFSICLIMSFQKKSISNIQRNSLPSSSMKRPTTPYRYAVSLSLLCNYNGCWSNFSACLSSPGSVVLQPLGALWSQWDPTAGRGLALTMPSFHIMRLWDLLGHPALTPGLIQLRYNALQLNVHWSLLLTDRLGLNPKSKPKGIQFKIMLWNWIHLGCEL